MEYEPLDLPPDTDHDHENAAEKVVRKTPWWSLSVGLLHAAAALIVAMFWVVTAVPETVVGMTPRPKLPPTVPDMDPIKRDPVDKPVDVPKVEEEVQPEPVKDPTQMEDPFDVQWREARGDSDKLLDNDAFKNPHTNSSIGVGGGAGGNFGHRGGDRLGRARQSGGGPKTEDAVRDALLWLARHQNPDGSWNVVEFTRQCKQTCSPHPGHDDFDAGVTGLSTLAFLGAGYSHLSRDVIDGICFGDVVRKAIQWMMSHQDPEGCIGSRNAAKYMYNHTICSLAMSEAYGLTGSQLFRDQAQKSIDFIIAAQNPGKAWRYSYKCGDNDSSVTGWAVMALKSAEISGLVFPRAGYDGTIAWYDEATEPSYGRVGYTHRNTGKVFVAGMNEHFDHHEALTAIGVMSRIFIDKNKRDARLSNGANQLLRDLPRWEGNAIDFYYWYYASLALFQFDGPKGSNWLKWNEPMKDALVKNQNVKSSGCRRGSWEPVGRWCGEGGRVYATAINCLTLEVYYRYVNVFGATK